MSGGVRNLRAMFEQNKEAEAPDRGRSPAGGSIGGGSNGTSPRPLSMVRTSFVAVERTGQGGNQLGLKRGTSGEPSLAKRRTSFSMDEEQKPQETAAMKETISTELEARKNNPAIKETVPESAVQTPPIDAEKKLSAPVAKRETSKPATSRAEPKVEHKIEHKEKAEPKDHKEQKKPIEHKKPAAGPSNAHANGTAKTVSAPKPAEKAHAPVTKPVSKPAPISTARTNVSSSKLSPTKVKTPLPKTPTSPNPPRPAKTPEPKKENKPARSSSAAPSQKPASKPTTKQAHGSIPNTRIGSSPPQTGFHKPRPKSPTRPVKLPASLTAHTASSGSKTATGAQPPPRQSLSRASGNIQAANSLQAHHAMSRSPSRASATVTRKPSTLKSGSSRPSLGPPPLKKSTSRPSMTDKAVAADDSFLARMMRPTTASASKTATTPPKRSQSQRRPTTRDGPKDFTPHASPIHKAHKNPVPVKVIQREAAPAKVVQKEVKPVVKKATHAAAPTKAKETPKPVVVKEAAKIVKNEKSIEKEPTTPVQPDVPASIPTPVEPEVIESKDEQKEVVVPEVTGAKEESVAQIEEPETAEVESVKEEPIVSEVVEEKSVHEETTLIVDDVVVPAPIEVEESKPEIAESVEAEKKDITEPIVEAEKIEESAPIIPEPEVTKDIPVVPQIESEAPKEETKVISPIVSPTFKPEEEYEDPEDIRAREEIARINAEFMKVEAEAAAVAAEAGKS